MPDGFPRIAFGASVRAEQERRGSRRQYARLEALRGADRLGERESAFIAQRDSFYIATVGESGYPYVQFRGGPPGFLKVLDERTLAYADFGGNRQYVSVGNLAHNPRAALILVDYAARQRLKIYATAEARDIEAAPQLAAALADPAYPARVERAMLLRVDGLDWNCPQHIVPRYTEAQVGEAIEPLRARIAELERELAGLRTL